MEALGELVDAGFTVADVTSTSEHLAVTLIREGERETLTFDRSEAGALFCCELLEGPERPDEQVLARVQADTLNGLIGDGFSVTDVSSADGELSITLRRGRDRETVTIEGPAARVFAARVLASGDVDDPGAETGPRASEANLPARVPSAEREIRSDA